MHDNQVDAPLKNASRQSGHPANPNAPSRPRAPASGRKRAENASSRE